MDFLTCEKFQTMRKTLILQLMTSDEINLGIDVVQFLCCAVNDATAVNDAAANAAAVNAAFAHAFALSAVPAAAAVHAAAAADHAAVVNAALPCQPHC